MINFSRNLEEVVKQDIKDEAVKTDQVIRSISRSGSQNVFNGGSFDL